MLNKICGGHLNGSVAVAERRTPTTAAAVERVADGREGVGLK
jgi:hypothetical protein